MIYFPTIFISRLLLACKIPNRGIVIFTFNVILFQFGRFVFEINYKVNQDHK